MAGDYHLLGEIHHQLVFNRRIRAIAQAIAPYLPSGRVLDFGAGNGELGALLMTMRLDIDVLGVDVYMRPIRYIPIVAYDGEGIPGGCL